ncbi:MAG: hypothetical protein LIO79_09090 [Rikenellaceae bacterium]|nr:hypothetical protein [Rikenellaceae bacterium]
MESNSRPKKRVVISYKNLSPELQAEVKKKYPYGYTDNMIRIDKSPTDFFYAIMLETEDSSYLIKVDVKVDTGDVEEEKDFFEDDITVTEEIADASEESEDE